MAVKCLNPGKAATCTLTVDICVHTPFNYNNDMLDLSG